MDTWAGAQVDNMGCGGIAQKAEFVVQLQQLESRSGPEAHHFSLQKIQWVSVCRNNSRVLEGASTNSNLAVVVVTLGKAATAMQVSGKETHSIVVSDSFRIILQLLAVCVQTPLSGRPSACRADRSGVAYAGAWIGSRRRQNQQKKRHSKILQPPHCLFHSCLFSALAVHLILDAYIKYCSLKLCAAATGAAAASWSLLQKLRKGRCQLPAQALPQNIM